MGFTWVLRGMAHAVIVQGSRPKLLESNEGQPTLYQISPLPRKHLASFSVVSVTNVCDGVDDCLPQQLQPTIILKMFLHSRGKVCLKIDMVSNDNLFII